MEMFKFKTKNGNAVKLCEADMLKVFRHYAEEKVKETLKENHPKWSDLMIREIADRTMCFLESEIGIEWRVIETVIKALEDNFYFLLKGAKENKENEEDSDYPPLQFLEEFEEKVLGQYDYELIDP